MIKQLVGYFMMNISVNLILIMNLFRPLDFWWYSALIALLLNLSGTLVLLKEYKKLRQEEVTN